MTKNVNLEKVTYQAIEWTNLPPDDMTARVVKDGIKIIYDPEG